MTAVLAIRGQKMEMIARDAEGACKPRRPQAHQSSVDVGRDELALRFRGVDQPRSRPRRIHRASPHALEASVQPKSVEDIAGATRLVAARFKVLEAGDRRDRAFRVWLEPGHDGKRSAGIARRLRDAPGALN